MKIRMLVSCATSERGYATGEIVDVTKEIATGFIKCGFAEKFILRSKKIEKASVEPKAEKAVK